MVATAAVQQQEGRPVDGSALAMGAAAACFPSLPDLVEPAVHPNHRRFFHSVTFATVVGYAMHRAYKWETRRPLERAARIALVIGGAAYLAHLVRDAFTIKSLPLI
jgi:membrane-bound metal-dependent hydrolase YbcI (DUF457 family)